MGIYTNIQPWSKDLVYQDISKDQKQFRRIELLLLNNPAGFFISHIQSNLRMPIDEIESILHELKARNIAGFWIHPHYFLNVRSKGMFPSLPTHSTAQIVQCDKLIDVLSNRPNASITYILHKTKINDPKDLVLLLKSYLNSNIDLNTQFIVGNFLYRRFNIKKLVVC